MRRGFGSFRIENSLPHLALTMETAAMRAIAPAGVFRVMAATEDYDGAAPAGFLLAGSDGTRAETSAPPGRWRKLWRAIVPRGRRGARRARTKFRPEVALALDAQARAREEEARLRLAGERQAGQQQAEDQAPA